MTLTIAPDIEARIRLVAKLSGQDPEDALLALLDQALTEVEAEAELVAELRVSVEDHAAGRSMTLEELRSRLLVRRQERDYSADEATTTEMAA